MPDENVLRLQGMERLIKSPNSRRFFVDLSISVYGKSSENSRSSEVICEEK
jgi:hypothetical protein